MSDFIGVWTPISILALIDGKKVKLNHAVVLGMVATMSKKRGYCFATNKYIGNTLGLSEKRIARILQELENMGHLIRKMITGRSRIM